MIEFSDQKIQLRTHQLENLLWKFSGVFGIIKMVS